MKHKISGDNWLLVDRLLYMYEKYDVRHSRNMRSMILRKVSDRLDSTTDTQILELDDKEWNELKTLVEQAKEDINDILLFMKREGNNGQTNK